MPTKASKLAPSAPLWVSRRSIRQRPFGPYLSCATRLAKMRAACLMLAASIVPKPLQMYFILPKLVIAKLGLGALLVTLSDVRGCVGSRRLGGEGHRGFDETKERRSIASGAHQCIFAGQRRDCFPCLRFGRSELRRLAVGIPRLQRTAPPP